MSPPHPELGPELRQLAQAVLDRLDPIVRAAAVRAADTQREPGACQQVWCPVCALAALVSGEQHPLLSVMAEHSATLLTVLRTMTADAPTAPADAPADQGSGDTPAAPRNGSYHHIPIVVEPVVEPVVETAPETIADSDGADGVDS